MHFLWLQETHDPWKWAQDTAEKISEENGFLIFIGGPPTEMGLAIYKDLPNNQAFVGTAYLKSMAEDGRVAVIHLPYSDQETIPDSLPQHLRNDPFWLPRDTNAFLCQLLDVKRRELFPCISYPLVRPKVRIWSPKKFFKVIQQNIPLNTKVKKNKKS